MPEGETTITNYNVLLDMDGVLADFEAGIETQAMIRHSLDLSGERQNYVQEAFPEHTDTILALPDQAGFFEELPLVAGAIQGIQRIIDRGYTPQICSALFTTNLTCETEKRLWLKRHITPEFGSAIERDAIFTDAKANHDGIALIDDKARIRNAARARWQHIIFRRPYNRAVETSWALNNWEDDQLEELLDRAAHLRAA